VRVYRAITKARAWRGQIDVIAEAAGADDEPRRPPCGETAAPIPLLFVTRYLRRAFT